jgi:hypothetical protein
MTNNTNNPVAPLNLAQFDGHTPGNWFSVGWKTATGRHFRQFKSEATGEGALCVQHDGSPEGLANEVLACASPAMLSELRTLRARNAEQEAALRDCHSWFTQYRACSIALPSNPVFSKVVAAITRAKEGRAEG